MRLSSPLRNAWNMADMNSEDAFLASLGQAAQEYDPAHQQPQPDIEDDEEEEEEEEEEELEAQEEEEEVEDDDEAEEEDDDDYDPSSFMPDAPLEALSAPITATSTPQPALAQPPQPPSQAASAVSSQVPSRTTSAQPIPAVQAAQKPKTIAGFIEEDDDDDEEDEEEAQNATVQHGANGALAVESQNTPLQSPPPSVSQTPSRLNTQVYNAEKDLATPDVVPNGTAPAESVSTPTSTLPLQGAPSAAEQKPATPQIHASSIAAAATAAPSSSSAISKPRLPQDRIGILEDRITEDPRGDIDAWLELIALHRQKNKLEDARQVYDRFFEFFPTAVSPPSHAHLHFNPSAQTTDRL